MPPTRRRKRTAASLTVLCVLLTITATGLSACGPEETSDRPRPAKATMSDSLPGRVLPSRAERAPEAGRPSLSPLFP